jgi:heat shock protein HtpX
VERLAARAGVLKPRLYLIPDGLPRALAAGRGPRGSALAVSRGLVAAAAPAELEAVLAHELAHVRNRDVVIQTSVVVLAATLLELSRIGGFLQRALLWILGPIAAAFVHLLLSPKREYLADRGAALICDSPHPMADALTRLDQAAELVDFSGSPATEPLYTINPFMEVGLARMFVTHPPIEERVRRLRESDPSWREKRRAA